MKLNNDQIIELWLVIGYLQALGETMRTAKIRADGLFRAFEEDLERANKNEFVER